MSHRGDGYEPTPACEELRPIIFGLAEWGARWAFGPPRVDELDPTVLMWWIRGGIDPEPFGDRRTVLHVSLPDGRRTRFWFVIDPDDVSLCFTDPGHEVDLLLESPLGTLYQLWEGVFELRAAMRDGLIRLTGRRELVLVFPEALRFSPVAPYVRRGLARPRPDPGPPKRQRPGIMWHVSRRGVVLMAAAACIGWLPFLWRSLSPDEGGFLIVASQWAPGSSLYGDYWVDRPPVLIGLFALADGLGDPWALRVLGILAVVATVLLAALVGRLAAPATRIGPLLAAGTAAIFVATPLFGGGVVNSEILTLPFIMAGLVAAIAASTAQTRRNEIGFAVLAGVAGTFAVLTKQSQVDVFVVVLVVALMTRDGPSCSPARRSARWSRCWSSCRSVPTSVRRPATCGTPRSRSGARPPA